MFDQFDTQVQPEETKGCQEYLDYQEYLSMINGLDDLKLLSSSFEGTSSLLYLINGSIKGINAYAKRLIETILHTRNALEFVEIIPSDRWITVKNKSANGIRDLVSEYNRRNGTRIKILTEDAESLHDVKVKRKW